LDAPPEVTIPADPRIEPVAVPARVPSPGRLRRALPALRIRDFRLFFFGQMVSLTGTWTQQVAQGWLVWTLSHSALMLGGLAALQSVPVLLFGVAGGVVADRLPRRNLLIATQVAAMFLALALAVLTGTGVIGARHGYSLGIVGALAVGLGVVNAVDAPTRQAFVVELVGRQHLLNAISLNSTIFNGARIVGPAVAGVLISVVGIPICFMVNAASFIPVIASLYLIRTLAGKRHTARRSVLGDARHALTYAWSTPLIRDLYLTVLCVSIVFAYASMLPLFADEVLHSGPAGYSALTLAGGIGSLGGAIYLAVSGEHRRRRGAWIVAAAVGYCVLVALFSLSVSIYISVALLVLVGFAGISCLARANTALQLAVPDEIRGGVMSIYVLLLMGLSPAGAVQLGALAHFTGAPRALTIESLACAGLLVVLHYRRHPVRDTA